MDKQALYSLDSEVYKQIQILRKQKEEENKAYFDGMEQGADMMVKVIKEYINLKGGAE